MITRLPTGALLFCLAAAMLLLAGSAQALTFISPMGEPFRTGPGEKPPEEVWFAQADTNHDGHMTRAEFMTDAGRFFKMLDADHNNEIGAAEIQHYEDDVAPEISGGFFDGGGGNGPAKGSGHPRRRGGRSHGPDDDMSASSDSDHPQPAYDSSGMGASRFGYFDLPEPVAAMDTNFDRSVSPTEFVEAANQRFRLLDANHDGVLTPDEFPHLSGGHPGPRKGR